MMTSESDSIETRTISSWQNKFLQDLLHTKKVFVKFVKKDGTERDMLCTLRSDLLPVREDTEEANKKKANPEVLAVYDLDKNAWRSFRYDSIIGFSEVSD